MKIVNTDECLIYAGWTDKFGYGILTAWLKTEKRCVTQRIHRVVYENEVGSIPKGMTIDHLCRVTSCVNVDHLEVVTGAENSRRSWLDINGQRARIDQKPKPLLVFCKYGHEFTPENTYWIQKKGKPKPTRECRTCNRRTTREYKERQKYGRREPKA